MSQHRKSKAEEFVEAVYCPETPQRQAVLERLRQDDKEGINVSAHEGSLLQLLLRAIQARSVLEIGTLYGYSTLWMAECLGDDGRLITLEANPAHALVARQVFSQSICRDRIELVEGPALEWMQSHSERTFDAVFIDANKSAYPDYLRLAMEMTREGGLIIADNCYLFGHVYGEPFANDQISDAVKERMREFHRMLSQEPRFFSTIIPTRQGLAVAIKKSRSGCA
jgi:predicted O-methyltransferase YrrM